MVQDENPNIGCATEIKAAVKMQTTYIVRAGALGKAGRGAGLELSVVGGGQICGGKMISRGVLTGMQLLLV